MATAFADDSLSYNGFNFDPTHFVSSKVRATNIYDDANREVKYVEFVIDVKGYISTGGTTDLQMDLMKNVLMVPGKALNYNARGFGTVIINQAAPGYDVDWGPKPEFLNFVPLGMGQACMYEWRVRYRKATCTGAVDRGPAFMLACYDVDWMIDEDGLTTITVNGAIEIPLTFRTGNILPDNADAYRERCFPPVPLGYQRGPKNSKLSKDRKRLDFSYTDKQLPVPLPNGMTKCKITHNVRMAKRNNTKQWIGTISGTLTSNPSIPKLAALDRFLNVAFGRIIITAQFQFGPDPIPVAERIREAGFQLLGFEMEENIFGLDSRFSISYRFLVGRGLERVVDASRLWRIPPTVAFVNWQPSVADNAHHPRGTARAYYRNSDDTIIDLCTQSGQQVSANQAGAPVSPDDISPPPLPLTTFIPPPVLSPAPAPEDSWVDYSTFIAYTQENNIAIHKPLAGTVTFNAPIIDPTSRTNEELAKQTDRKLGTLASEPDITQRLSSPSIRVVLFGFARRIGYPIAPPRLIKFAGSDVEELSLNVVDGVESELGGTPTNITTWRIVYVVKSPPAQLPTLQNPLQPIGDQSLELLNPI